MQNKTKKTLSIILSVLILALALASPISALSYKKGNNVASAAYAASDYYKKLTSISLTGDNRTDLIAVALSQLGYTEGNYDGAFGGNEQGNDNFTEYNYNMGTFGVGYGGRDYPWCASFVSFCLLQSGAHNQTRIADWCRKNEGNPDYIWREVSCQRWAKQLRTCGYFENSAHFGGDYLPIPGDLIFFTEDQKLESHIGIVLYSDGEFVYTVEGNTSSSSGLETNGGGVYTKAYHLSSTYIRGYGVLPYKVDNFIYHIDYSGTYPTAGTYITTTEKFVYLTETASTYTYLLPKYSFFEVTEVAENGRLRAVCEIDGKTVEGYVKNNSDRVIQLSSTEKPTGYAPLEKVWGYKRSCIDFYIIDNASHYTKPSDLTVAISTDLTVCGNASLTRDITAFGYYFDDEREDIIWNDDAKIADASLDAIYKIVARTDSLSAGRHELHFVMMLADKTVCEIDSLSFVAKLENSTVPDAPTLEKFTDDSITLVAKEGYEYKLGEGNWQSSPTFEGLWQNTTEPYKFYQRVRETETMMPSVGSPALSLDLAALCNLTKLTAMSVKGAELSPEFDPDVTEYTLRVPNSVTKVIPDATAREGAKIEILTPDLEAGKNTEIKITVSADQGFTHVYKINVFREEIETTDTPETEPPSDASESSADLDTAPDNNTDFGDSTVDTEPSELGCEGSLPLVPITLIALLGVSFVKKKD